MAKITKQEFENYHQEFLSAFSRIMCTSEFKSMGKEDQEKIEKIFGLLLNEIQSGNILALYGSCEEVEGKLNEDYSAIKRRVKEHIIARGYYNPASPLSLAEFRERMKKRGWKNFKELWENKEQIKKLLSEMNEENRNFIKSTFYLFEQIDEIVQDKEEKEWTEEQWKKTGFIEEDILKVLEEAQNRLAERERERETIPAVPLSLTLTNRLIRE